MTRRPPLEPVAHVSSYLVQTSPGSSDLASASPTPLELVLVGAKPYGRAFPSSGMDDSKADDRHDDDHNHDADRDSDSETCHPRLAASGADVGCDERGDKDRSQHAEGCHHDGRLHVVRIVGGPAPELSQHSELLPAVGLRESVNSRNGNSTIFVQMCRLQLHPCSLPHQADARSRPTSGRTGQSDPVELSSRHRQRDRSRHQRSER